MTSRSIAGAARGWRTCTSSAATFRTALLCRLEQNYRSTGAILAAANGLIAHNSGRLGKNLWTSGEQGEPIRLYAAFNERDEAEFVVAAHPRLGRSAAAPARDRDPVPLQRAVARVRRGVPLGAHAVQGVRRPAVLRARGNQGCARLPAPHFQPQRRRLLRARGEPADARHRRQESGHHPRAARSGAGSTLWEAAAACIGRCAWAPKASQALHGFMSLIERLAHEIRGAAAARAGGSRAAGQRAASSYYKREKADRGEARVENLESS